MTNGRLPTFSDNPLGSCNPPFVKSAGSPFSQRNVYCPVHVVSLLSECEWREGEGKSQAIRVSEKVGQREICVDLKIASPVI